MKIAYVCADFGVPVFGRKGASVHLREVVGALAECGHDVRVFAPVLEDAGFPRNGQQPLEGSDPGAGGRVAWVAVPPDPQHSAWLDELRGAEELLGQPTRLRQELRNLLYNLPLRTHLMRALAAEPADFVYERYALFGLAGIAAARALGVPHLLEVNAPLAEEQERMRGLEMKQLARSAEQRILRSTDAAIVVSRRLAEFASSCGVPGERIHVLPNAVDPRRFAPGVNGRSPAAENAGAPTPELRERLRGRCVIGFVGSLKRWHGVETLLEAFHALTSRRPDVHLVVVGDGPAREELECSARERGIGERVTFTGAVAHEQVPSWIALMDVAAAPYTPHENFYFSPMKLFEYMAMGVPVVAGRIGQVEELLADGASGVLHEPGDAAGLAAALERLAADPGMRRRIGEAGRRGVGAERTWRGNAERIVALAGEAAARGARSREVGAAAEGDRP